MLVSGQHQGGVSNGGGKRKAQTLCLGKSYRGEKMQQKVVVPL